LEKILLHINVKIYNKNKPTKIFMKKAIILARVSTEDQLNEGMSIPAQIEKARAYAQKKGLVI